MIKRQYSGNERRARNYIWNAAGRYDFEPSFLAFGPDGSPDMYFNMVIGLAYKWLDMERILRFIAQYSVSRSADEYDDFFWLGIENCVYEKEIGERPMLLQLRKNKAEDYFRSVSGMSRQQMEMQSMAVYDQQMIRWSWVTGKTCHAGKRSEELASRLKFSGDLDAEGVVAEMTAVLADFFRADPGKMRKEGPDRGILERVRSFLPKDRGPRQRLFLRTGDGVGTLDTNVHLTHTRNRRIHYPTAEDELFIREAFGISAVSDREREGLERDCCRDLHVPCRLHITEGAGLPEGGGAVRSAELREIRKKAEEQEKINRKFVSDQSLLVSESIRSLSAELDLLFTEYFRMLPERGRAGRLIPEKAYRLPVFRDPSVFSRDGSQTEMNVQVTLLLDASMSRMNVQEIIASEAYIIAKSLEKIHVPVQVLTFRTIRGYTVLERLKRSDRMGADGVLRFFSGGWNRDGLAFRAAKALVTEDAEAPDTVRLLIILTDACPNDDVPAVTDPSGRILKEYEGTTAVRDTENAVRSLRDAGIRTAAVFFGSTAHLENVQQIYGKEYVRIRRLNRIADGVTELIRIMMQEMTLQNT